MVVLDIELPKNKTKDEVENGINLILSNYELFEDFLLGLKINEVQNEEIISLDEFLQNEDNS